MFQMLPSFVVTFRQCASSLFVSHLACLHEWFMSRVSKAFEAGATPEDLVQQRVED